MNKIILVILFFTILYSCGKKDSNSVPNESSNNTERKVVEEKKEIVMRIHDEAMEKMGAMAQLKSELKSKITSDSLNIDSLKQAILYLEEADKIMWDWMHNYHNEIVDTSSIPIALDYLKDQHQKVLIVEEKINSSLTYGKSFL